MKNLTAYVMAATVAMSCAPALSAFEIASKIPDIEIALLESLPFNLDSHEIDAECSKIEPEPTTPGGRFVKARGWAVTAEVTVGERTWVSFAGTATRGTSGTCLLTHGNIAIFHGTSLDRIIYQPAGARDNIGFIVELASDHLRIHDGNWLSLPLADIRFYAPSLAVIRHITESHPVCQNAVVPDIYGLTITQARAVLSAYGWQPGKPQDPATDTRLQDFAVRQITEVESCSGTGLGFCRFIYEDAQGNNLGVITAGEQEGGVVGYDHACKGDN